jgi:hypothetical protein
VIKSKAGSVAPRSCIAAYRKVRAAYRKFLFLLKYYQMRRRLDRDPNDWSTLREISRVIGHYLHNHKLYTSSIRHADPELTLLELTEPQFVEKGSGAWNLNAYRCGGWQSGYVFEKIYLMDSDAWHKLTWAYETVLPCFEETIRKPNIVCIVRGEKLAAVYFEYIPGAQSISFDELISRSLHFYRTIVDFRSNSIEPEIWDFRREVMYCKGVKALRFILKSNNQSVELQVALEDRLLQPDVPRVFTHGDLVPQNILKCGIILDFDKCGYYPSGYEFSRFLVMIEKFDDIDSLESFAEEKIVPGCPLTRICVLYVAAIFYSRRLSSYAQVSDDFILELLFRSHRLMENTAPASSNIK